MLYLYDFMCFFIYIQFSSNTKCGGEWMAARNKSLKKRSTDVTGLEVAVCRHQIAQKAVNMTQGELFGYGLYLVKHFIVQNEVEYLFADVMCKFYGFMKRVEPSIASKIKGALSVMHAKGHSLECQVYYFKHFFLQKYILI